MWTDTTRAQYARAGLTLPSDLTDAEWKIVRPLLPGHNRLGRPRKLELLQVWNAIQYLAAAGCAWPRIGRNPSRAPKLGC